MPKSTNPINSIQFAAYVCMRNEIARFVLKHWQGVDGGNMLSFKGIGIETEVTTTCDAVISDISIMGRWQRTIP